MSKFIRKENTRDQYKKVYIFTEGKKTEVLYFQAKKIEIEDSVERANVVEVKESGAEKDDDKSEARSVIKIRGVGKSTKKLLDFAIAYIKNNEINLALDDCWIVFDKDDFKDQDFNDSIEKAKKEDIKVAYSNESFELWFFLHFHFNSTALHRNLYNKKLEDELKKVSGNKNFKYSKTENIYPFISDKESVAIRNAKKLEQEYHENEPPSERNPSTLVYLLIEELNNLKKEQK